MDSFNLDSVAAALQSTGVSSNGVSFAGKSLKLDNESDAEPIVTEINKCSTLEYLNLEGNTLGVEASKGIAKALEKHSEFKRAIWKDMFTGRMKTEIPKALQYLGDGLVTAGARLTELDLSDNAFGPIGVEGLASLLRSSSCYALEELRLNNNGLGITGGKLLAGALTDCFHCSKKEGKPLALKVFIAGRNRLENDGAKALAHVFKMLGTLKEIAMPQNGIYHKGITALSDAFKHNRNLRVLNLNDNTVGGKGAEAIAKVLPNLQSLKEINFGDCLLKTKGAVLLARALKENHLKLEELIVGFNEIRKDGALELIVAMTNKIKLKNLVLDGNQFGEEGKEEVRRKLAEIGKLNVLGSLDDDESEESEEEDESEEGEEEEEQEDEENESTESEQDEVTEVVGSPGKAVTVDEFIETSNAYNFMALGNNRIDLLLKEAKKNGDICVDSYIKIIMKVASLSYNAKPEIVESSLKCTELLYKDLFIWSQQVDKTSVVNNTILVNLGFIKSEDKKYKPAWNIESCLNALNNIIKKNYVPESTKNTLKIFVQREIEKNTEFLAIKMEILSGLP